MIIDLRSRGDHFTKNVDLCIVGAGAAGIALAQSFNGTGIEVCLIESGGLDFADDTQALYAGSSIGQPVALEAGRERFLGGCMNHWGGRCAEFSDAELAKRSWIPDSGWPLTSEDLAPFYRRARVLAGMEPEWQPFQDVLKLLGVEPLANLTPAAALQVWRFAPNDRGLYWNFGKMYYGALRESRNVSLLLNANLTQIHTTQGNRHVETLTVKSLHGTTGTITAQNFVLSCGAIENARLLLSTCESAPAGLGNDHDVVGRYFMEHSRATAAAVIPKNRFSGIQDLFNESVGPDGVSYMVGLMLSEEAQRSDELLNCSAMFAYEGDPESGSTAAQDIWRKLRYGRWPADVGSDVWRIMRDMRGVGVNLERHFHHGRPPLLPVEAIDLVVDIEQVPDRDSRVTLGDKLDALGLPKVVVDWRVSELERETARAFMLHLGADFSRRGLGRMRLEPWVLDKTVAWKSGMYETYHYMGTTRISANPRTGVVDENCRVHGIDNLFVGGSSVFPTGGHVNPTLTIIALALRLSDHLHARMTA